MTTPILWSTEHLLNTPNGEIDSTVRVKSFSDGSFIAVWDGGGVNRDGTLNSNAILGRFFNADGTPKSAEFILNSTVKGPQNLPEVTILKDGRFVVAWEDFSNTDGETTRGIRARIFNKDGTPYDKDGDGVGESDFLVNTVTTNHQLKPSVTALSDGGFVIAYQSDASFSGVIQLQAYDAAGNKVGGEIQAHGSKSTPQTIPVVQGLSGNRFVVLWADAGPADDQGALTTVRGRIMTPGSTSGGTEFLVPSSRGSKKDIAVTELSDGKFIVAWSQFPKWDDNTGSDGSGASVKAQIFNADGTVYRGEFMVNEPTSNNQHIPSITALPGGGFAIAYIDVSTGSNLIRVAIFDKEGGRSNGEVVVGPPPGATVGTKAVLTTLADGRILVAWDENSSTRVDDQSSVRGQIIDPRTSAVNLSGTSGNDEFYGTIYSDVLRGSDGVDKLSGDASNDTLNGGLGADTLNGGRAGVVASSDGIDFASYADSSGVTASLLTPAANTGEAAGDVYISIEGLIGSSQADNLSGDNNANTLIGGGGNDQLFGNDGADLLTGDDGEDLLDGGLGADLLQGGKGNDSYIVDNALDDIDEHAGEGDDAVTTSVSYALDAMAAIEVLRAQAGTASINLTGNGIGNELFGNDGTNVLNGGTGVDALDGGDGNDTYVLDNINDTVIEGNGVNSGYDTVSIEANFAADGIYRVTDYANVEALTVLDNAGQVNLAGSAIGNKLIGNSSSNELEGLGGDDTIDGGGGVNTAVFTGAKSEYIITKNAVDGTITIVDTVTGRDGTDLLKNIKYARFSDETVDLLQALPSVSISAHDAAKAEGDTGYVEYTFKVTRSGTSGPSSVNWAITGLDVAGAASASDFDAATLSGTVDFLDGQNEQYVTVRVMADKEIEGHETFSVTLSSPTDATLGATVATGTIINDDVLPVLSIAATDAVKAEGDTEAYTSYNFVVTRSGSSGVSTAVWTVKGIGADAAQDEDFLALTGTVRFEDTETSKVITIRIKTDTILETDETFSVVLSSPQGATIITDTAYGTIANDDVPVDAPPTNIRFTTVGTATWIDESKPAGSVVAAVTADDDKGTSSLRYSMTDSIFEIDAVSGQIRIKNGVVLDFETKNSYTVTVTATDLNGTGQATTQDIVINLTDIAEKATHITFGDVKELQLGVSKTGALVAVAQAFDLDASGAAANLYRFDNGESTTSDGLFVINANTGQISTTRALTASDVGIKTLNVVAYDAANPSLYTVQSHTVTIIGESNAAPYDISLSQSNIDENSLVGSVIATLSALDPQGSYDIKDFEVIGDDDGKFVIVGNELRLKAGIDRETKGSHQVTIRVTDKAGNSFDETFTITVNDVNEKANEIIVNGVQTLKVGVTGKGSSVMSATATDLDATNGFSTNLYRFENGQTTLDGLFTINAYTGQVTVARTLTAEDTGTRTLTVVAYDASNSTLFQVQTQEITILGPGNLKPTDLTLDGTTIAENSGAGTVIGTLGASDPDSGETFTYSIVEDADGKFAVVDGKLVVRAGATLDYEGKTSHQVKIRVTDKGGLSHDEVFTINITNANDETTDVSLSASVVDEESSEGAFVGSIVTNDQDGSASHTYELLDDAGGRFKLSADGKSILVADGSLLNYEATTSHTVRVRVTDGSLSYEKDIVIRINNVLEAGSPSINVDPGKVSTSTADNGAAVKPLTGVTFADPQDDTLTVKVSFAAAAGDFVPTGELAGATAELTGDGRKIYTFVGKASDLDNIMSALQFQAAANPGAKAGTVTTTTFRIEATDGNSLVANEDVNLVTNVANRAPTDISLSGSFAFEMAGVGGGNTFVGSLSASDQAEAGFTYSLLNTAGGRFKLGADGRSIFVDNGFLLDFEQARAHTIRVKVSDQDGASFEKDLVINVGDVTGEDTRGGSPFDDVFVGGFGKDNLYGSAGNDTLNGGDGNDVLVGGKGKDVFVFNTKLNKRTNKDKILEWSSRDDTIHLDNDIFKKLAKTGKLQSKYFTLGSKAKDANDFIGVNKANGDVWYDSNGSKAGGQTIFANIGKNKAVSHTDFFIF
jgi:Ca2+-binding RTX toxin-like protein